VVTNRSRLASFIDFAGLTRAILAARARAIFPWRWLTVLTYHRVAAPGAVGFDPEVVDATPEAFDQHVRLLKRYFTLIDTRDLDAWRAGGSLPENPAMLTFDDGYRDNHDVALPILRRHGVKAVFFIATIYVSERRLFWWERINRALASSRRERLALRYPASLDLPTRSEPERRRAVKTLLELCKGQPHVEMDRLLDELYAACGLAVDRDEERRLADAMVMSWDHVRALGDAGMDVQSHSHSHKVLQTLSVEDATRDLIVARQALEGATGRPVHALAYPTGRPVAEPALREAVLSAGYRYGFTLDRLVPLERITDWLGIPRMVVDGSLTDAFYRSCLAIPPLAY
jgi:peptidoglycan/xylan/chitin deacetylase (PgdA/CDA1 family)